MYNTLPIHTMLSIIPITAEMKPGFSPLAYIYSRLENDTESAVAKLKTHGETGAGESWTRNVEWRCDNLLFCPRLQNLA